MHRERRILGLIAARGGSKGLPRKNVLPLLGKPLIGWTVEQGKASRYLDRLIVSTDAPEIAEVSKSFGAEVPFMRPEELARDTSPVIDTVLHAVDFCERQGDRYDYLVLLEPTSPLRKEGDIDRAIARLIEHEGCAESCISVGEIALEHPVYAKRITDGGYVVPFAALGTVATLRQQIPRAYFPYGVIYLASVAAMRQHRAVYPERILPYVIERWQNYEINDRIDFLCVETILRQKQEGAL